MSTIALVLAALGLLVVIGATNYLYPPLRNETISSGLTGRYHALLDGSYLILAAALVWRADGRFIQEVIAIVSALSLIGTAVTNTAWAWVDKLSGGKHSLWHSRCTAVVFASAILFQVICDHGALWLFTAFNVAIPLAIYGYFRFFPTSIGGVVVAASPAAEKAFVGGLCLWFAIWPVFG